jgi:hypothetical protein
LLSSGGSAAQFAAHAGQRRMLLATAAVALV